MRIVGISGHGLAGMAAAVGLLWSCLLSEHLIIRLANREQSQALREIQRLRGTSQPVRAPAPYSPGRPGRG